MGGIGRREEGRENRVCRGLRWYSEAREAQGGGVKRESERGRKIGKAKETEREVASVRRVSWRVEDGTRVSCQKVD